MNKFLYKNTKFDEIFIYYIFPYEIPLTSKYDSYNAQIPEYYRKRKWISFDAKIKKNEIFIDFYNSVPNNRHESILKEIVMILEEVRKWFVKNIRRRYNTHLQ